MRRTLLASMLLVAVLPGGAGAQSGASVSMDHFAFTPEELTVEAGTTVTWTYDANAEDPEPNCESPQFRANDSCPGHSTTAKDKGADGRPLWDSGVHRAEGFPFSHTFTRPGRYEYFCVVHGGEDPNNPVTAMNGVIVVTAAEGGPTPAEPDPGPVADGTRPGSAQEGATDPAEGRYAGGVVPVTGGSGTTAAGVGLLALAALARGRRRQDAATSPR